MKGLCAAVTVMAVLVGASSAAAATVPVTSLSGQFAASNPSVARTSDGVQFGPYANGGVGVGSVIYNGANGLTLSQITSLAYPQRFNTTDQASRFCALLRVFLDDNGRRHRFRALRPDAAKSRTS